MNGMKLQSVLSEVAAERVRQNKLWGQQDHEPEKWFSILFEETGEAAKSVNDGDLENYREELIQVAAVAVQMVECFDRNRGDN